MIGLYFLAMTFDSLLIEVTNDALLKDTNASDFATLTMAFMLKSLSGLCCRLIVFHKYILFCAILTFEMMNSGEHGYFTNCVLNCLIYLLIVSGFIVN